MNDLSYTDRKRLADLAKQFAKKEKPIDLLQQSLPSAKQSLDDLVTQYSYGEISAIYRSYGLIPKGRKGEMIAVLLKKGFI